MKTNFNFSGNCFLIFIYLEKKKDYNHNLNKIRRENGKPSKNIA